VSLTGSTYLAHLATRRAYTKSAKKRRKKRIRVRPLRQPDAIRRKYRAAILDLAVAPAVAAVRALMESGPSLAEDASSVRGDALVAVGHSREAWRNDTASKASKLIRKMADDFFAEFTDEKIAPLAKRFARETSEFHKAQMGAQIKAAISVDVPFTDPKLFAMVEEFTAENVSLIRSIPRRMFDEVESTLLRDLRAGLRWEEIAPEIEDRFGVSESRAELIARDQVGKFFGEVNAQRQQDLGVEKYVWRTARDNRVREEHMEREGKSYEWGELGADEEPGQPINCRCQAEPDLAALLKAMEGD
jgi:SPP1 gp7 family putative phage head morphogenesis protein